jgi:sulfur transfer protein SufE
MADFSHYPDKLREVLEIFAENPGERNQMLIEYSDQFQGVPDSIAARPYPLTHQVPHCESDSYVFYELIDPPDSIDGDSNSPNGADSSTGPAGSAGSRPPRLKFHFAVENPFGVSARALSAILDSTISGLPADEIANMPIEDIVPTLFGKNISMGKGQGLLSIAAVVKKLAQRHAERNGQ